MTTEPRRRDARTDASLRSTLQKCFEDGFDDWCMEPFLIWFSTRLRIELVHINDHPVNVVEAASEERIHGVASEADVVHFYLIQARHVA